MTLTPDKFIELVEKGIRRYTRKYKKDRKSPRDSLLSTKNPTAYCFFPDFGFTGGHIELITDQAWESLFEIGVEYRFPLDFKSFDQSKAIESVKSHGVIRYTFSPFYKPDTMVLITDLKNEKLTDFYWDPNYGRKFLKFEELKKGTDLKEGLNTLLSNIYQKNNLNRNL